jgi:hypothetical protein
MLNEKRVMMRITTIHMLRGDKLFGMLRMDNAVLLLIRI